MHNPIINVKSVREEQTFRNNKLPDLQLEMKEAYFSKQWYRLTKQQHDINPDDHSKSEYFLVKKKCGCLNTLYYCSCHNTNGT
jgi:hypothetical protein